MTTPEEHEVDTEESEEITISKKMRIVHTYMEGAYR
jgi:hypothetical protein